LVFIDSATALVAAHCLGHTGSNFNSPHRISLLQAFPNRTRQVVCQVLFGV